MHQAIPAVAEYGGGRQSTSTGQPFFSPPPLLGGFWFAYLPTGLPAVPSVFRAVLLD